VPSALSFLIDKPLDVNIVSKAAINAILIDDIEGVLEVGDIERLAKSSIE
jgi:hypothetical protein